jgi:RNA-directed DNA polymerase
LKKLAIDCGCTYTRYADDITFSSPHGRFPPLITYRDTAGRWVIGEGIAKIVAGNSFVINPSKTRLLPRGYRQEVTGLVVGRRVNVKRIFLLQVRAMVHAAEKWGVERASQYFHNKYDQKQRLKKPDFLRVLRGKIEFIGAVRGRDDAIYLGLLLRYVKLNPGATVRPIMVSDKAEPAIVEKAVWLLEQPDGDTQGTAFSAENFDLITAAHASTPTTEASCPALAIPFSKTRIVYKEEHVDVARMALEFKPPVQLKLGTSANLRIGDAIKVLGFPLHRKGGTVHVQTGKITQFSPWFGVPHYVVDCPIVRGNSGGPVLNQKNEVIGIAVKGQGTPKQYKEHDELSRFVPIDFALDYLKRQPTKQQSTSSEPSVEPAVQL